MRNTFGLALALLLVACGGGGLGTTNDLSGPGNDLAMTLSSGDMAAPTHDLAISSNSDASSSGASDMDSVACGSMTCGAGVECCITPNNGSPTYACMAQCGSGTIAASCDGPEDCTSGTCCANIALSGSSPSGDAMCSSSTNTCSTGNLNIGTMSITTKLCHQTTDCAGYQGNFGAFTSCCAYPGVSYSFCAPSIASGQMGITCQP
jgi:hypothetical protein